MRVGDQVRKKIGWDENNAPILEGPTGVVIDIQHGADPRDGEFQIMEITVRWETGAIQKFDRKEETHLNDLEEVTPLLYVNVYLWDKAYGGGEEGGWYYNTYDPVDEESVLASSVEEAETLAEEKRKWCETENADRCHPSSVNSDGHYVVRIEAWPAEPEPKRQPHYC